MAARKDRRQQREEARDLREHDPVDNRVFENPESRPRRSARCVRRAVQEGGKEGLGGGEELVTGRVTPDTFVLNKRTGMIRERRIAEKRKMKVPSGHGAGLAEVAIPRRLRRAQ